MKIDFKNPNPVTRFYIDEKNKKDCGWADLRIPSNDEQERIDKATVTKKEKFKRGQRFEVEKVDETQRNRLLWDCMIPKFGNFTDQDGKEIKCTTDNKYFLMNEVVVFAAFVGRSIETLADDLIDVEDGKAKNSKST